MFNNKRISELEAMLNSVQTTADQAAKLAVHLQKISEAKEQRLNALSEKLLKVIKELDQLYAKTGCTKYQIEKTGPQ